MYSEPIGYLLTVRCYGTWLPGDDRGWVSRGDNVNSPLRLPSPALQKYCSELSNFRPGDVRDFTGPERAAATEAVEDLCRRRNWMLHAINVRTNHLHAVLNCPCNPEQAINDIKSRITRELRNRRMRNDDERVWSGGGSKRYLWTTDDLAFAVRYVVELQ